MARADLLCLTPVVLFDAPYSSASLFAALARIANPPPSSATLTTVRRYFTCLERSTWMQLADLISSNLRYRAPYDAAGFRIIVEGREQFVRFAETTFAEFISSWFTLESVRDVNGGAIVRYTGSWLDAQHERVGMRGSIFVGFEAGLIQELDVRLDSAQLRPMVMASPLLSAV